MTYNEILSDLKKKIYHPIYFLTGEEPYYIDKITEYIEKNVLTDQEKTFNQMMFYGKDTDIGTIINTAKRFPMMANYQVVIVKEAQNIKKIEDLIYYIEKPLKSTILVLNYKYKLLDKRTKLYKSLNKNGIFFNSGKIYEDKIPGWIQNFLKERAYSIEPGIGLVLTDFLGSDLSKIVNELEKLIIVLPKGKTMITADLVEKNIGISKEYNNLEFNKALGRKDILKANRIANYFCKNPNHNPLTLTISSLYYFFSKVLAYHFVKDKSRGNLASKLKINPYFISEYQAAARLYSAGKIAKIISLIRKYDLKSKGMGNVSMSDCELLKELTYQILH